MRKIILIMLSLAIASYMIVGRNYMLDGIERHLRISNDVIYSKDIDLCETNTFSWIIKKDDWDYTNGVAQLFLVFNRNNDETNSEYWEKHFQLKVKINAYAKTENNVKAFRFIKNYFYPTDEPMAKETKLWSGWSDEKLEYPLGSLMRFPMEDLIIELTVQVPDPILNKATPRMKLVGDYDPAVLGFVPFAKLLRDIGLIGCLVGLLFITRHALLACNTTDKKLKGTYLKR